MRIKLYLLILVVLALSFLRSNAQGISSDTTLYSNMANKAVDLYNDAIAEQSEIYNGIAYELQPLASRGSVYFQDKNYCTPGAIRYNGTLYKNIPVLYDSYSDVMVAASRNFFNYILQAEKVADVYMLDHHFIYLDNETAVNLKPGYYDELYDGKTLVLVKRTKTVNNNVTAQAVEVRYTDKNDIYIKKGGKYYNVDSKGSVFNMLKDKKKELSQYLNSNKIKYNKNRESSVASLARYYDQITN